MFYKTGEELILQIHIPRVTDVHQKHGVFDMKGQVRKEVNCFKNKDLSP